MEGGDLAQEKSIITPGEDGRGNGRYAVKQREECRPETRFALARIESVS